MLVAQGIRKRFGGVLALDGVDVAIQPGQVSGLIGRNGSGKSTLFNCISGFLKPSAGQVRVDGRDISAYPPERIVACGVARTFQTPRVEPRATVGDAILCGFYTKGRSNWLSALAGLPRAVREERRLREAAFLLLERLGLAEFAHVEIGKLSMGRVRLVEVGRCLAAGSRFLLLDEPAAGLTREEQSVLAEQIRRVAADGAGVLLVEHNFDLIRALCRDVTVLDEGRVLYAGASAEVARDPRVVAAYLGTAAA